MSLRTPGLRLLAVLALSVATGGARPEGFDVVIRGGTVYDGTGTAGRRADVGLRGDAIAQVGDLSAASARTVVDARGLAVAPGFINMLSWSTESLIVDGRSQGEIRQGVTTEIFGEGNSMGPLTDEMKRRMKEEQGDLKYVQGITLRGPGSGYRIRRDLGVERTRTRSRRQQARL